MSAITISDFVELERFFAASMRNIERLHDCQKHDEARRVLCGLRRLANTVSKQGAEHGYLADIVLNHWPERIARMGGSR